MLFVEPENSREEGVGCRAERGWGWCRFPDTEFIIGRFLFTVPRHLPREPRARNV